MNSKQYVRISQGTVNILEFLSSNLIVAQLNPWHFNVLSNQVNMPLENKLSQVNSERSRTHFEQTHFSIL